MRGEDLRESTAGGDSVVTLWMGGECLGEELDGVWEGVLGESERKGLG